MRTPSIDVSAVQLRQQLVGASQIGNHDAAANHEGHIDRFLLLGATYAQPVGLDDMVVDAVVAAQASRSDQSHQLFVLCRQRTSEIGVVVEVVEALDQKVISSSTFWFSRVLESMNSRAMALFPATCSS